MSRATRLCPRGDFVHVARLGGYYDLKYYRRCDYLIGNTRAIVDYAVAEGWPRERVDYLPNFVPDAGARRRAQERAGAPLAVALGRLHPNKGFDLLLDALAATREVDLWIAGDGPLRPRLEGRAAELGLADRVRFLGWREDVAGVAGERRSPRLSVAARAAGQCRDRGVVGRPAGRRDGERRPRQLIEDGENGLLVPLPDRPGGGAAALARAIERVCRDPALRARLGRAGRLAYEREFTEAAVVARYRGFFERVTR